MFSIYKTIETLYTFGSYTNGNRGKMNAESDKVASTPQNPRKLKGLNGSEVLILQQQHGRNILPSEKLRSGWGIFFSQFKSPLIYIILVAALISLFTKGIPDGDYGDFAIIMIVVLIDTLLGFLQENQAQKTYSSLKRLLKPSTTVIRDGQRSEIDVSELVPGDLVLLNAGEKIPGDGTIIEATKISIDESILTGESEPIRKDESPGHNQVFMGTTIVSGRGMMQVDNIGVHTELGKIADSLKEPIEQETPLQIRLKSFSKTLTYIVAGFTGIIFFTGIVLRHDILEMARTSIILAIAAVPEGLLIAVTVILVLGMRKILKRNALVKRMLAVETLGSVTTICTDKTGTLTEGRMRVTREEITDRDHAVQTMVLCNNLEGPVEVALWEYARLHSTEDPDQLVNRSERMAEELFSSETKFMITQTMVDGEEHFFLKGAPEIILQMCELPAAEKQQILQKIDSWARDGLRLLGFAYRVGGILERRSGYAWLGLVGMEDPIRGGVIDAIRVARQAGIAVKMITGDYRITAELIARKVGILMEGDQILEGEDLNKLTDDELKQRVGHVSVFARIRPQDKLRIVRALQANGEITAMIGDGVNDAPAIKRANIGVVVGEATDVARETADVVLMDGNFKTIVSAVEEGRIIFENIRKVVAYTLSNSFAEVLTIFFAMLFRWPAPLLVAQILWIHLICDGPSDIVLGFEPKEYGIMDEKPKSLKESILSSLGLILIALISVGSAIAALIIFIINVSKDPVAGAQVGRSMVFASFAINSMIYIFAYRSMRQSLFRMPSLKYNKPLIFSVAGGIALVVLPFMVPQLRTLLQLTPLSWRQWVLIAGIAFGLLIIVEIGKLIRNRWQRKRLIER
jgi:Ca2+-transporting ATPase